jgi:hypothetical protein
VGLAAGPALLAQSGAASWQLWSDLRVAGEASLDRDQFGLRALGDRGSHGLDLTLESVDEVVAVASVDQQQFVAW